MTSVPLTRVFNRLKWRELAVTWGFCPVCAAKRPIIRLHRGEIGIRCLACRSTPVTMALVATLHRLVPDLSEKEVYELSSRGPLVRFLKKHCAHLTCSEYLDGVPAGTLRNGVLCQDVQQLTFADKSFDLCTSTEVFEHVPDDLRGFAEIRRVLRPGGLFLFTVPLFPAPKTVERARLEQQGEINHLLPPHYHGDPIRGHQPVLVFRDYGQDILHRLEGQGFTSCRLLAPPIPLPWNCPRRVVAAQRPMDPQKLSPTPKKY